MSEADYTDQPVDPTPDAVDPNGWGDPGNWTYSPDGQTSDPNQFNWVNDPNSDQQYNASGDINDPSNWRDVPPGEATTDPSFDHPTSQLPPNPDQQQGAISASIEQMLTDAGVDLNSDYAKMVLGNTSGTDANGNARTLVTDANNNTTPMTTAETPNYGDGTWKAGANGRFYRDTPDATQTPQDIAAAAINDRPNQPAGPPNGAKDNGQIYVNPDQARQELKKAGYPQWESASDANIMAAYARTATGGAATGAPKIPGVGSTVADFQKYVNAVIESNNKRYADERSDKEAEKARLDRAQKLSIITELLKMSTGPGGPRNLNLALSLLGAIDNLSAAEKAAIQMAAPANLRKRVLGNQPVAA